MIDGVGHACVFCHALVGKVDFAFGIYSYVLEQGVATDSVVDVRLALLVKIDYLGIAAAFVVEHAFVVPSVFVVTYELALGVGRECGLAGAAQAEEDGC